MKWLSRDLKHAFAVDPPGPQEPTEAQKPAVDRVCKAVARRRLTTPALVFLEMTKPLNFITAQTMHLFEPVASVFLNLEPVAKRLLDYEGYRQFAAFLEHRGSVEYLCRRIEYFEKLYEEQERAEKQGTCPDDDSQSVRCEDAEASKKQEGNEP